MPFKEGKMTIESTRKKGYLVQQIIRDPRGALRTMFTISRLYVRHIVGTPPLECQVLLNSP